jgi:hypothetical protein
MTPRPDRHHASTTKQKPQVDSWWTKYADPESDWSAFTEAARQRDLEIGWTRNGDRTRPSAMEERL